MGERRFLGQDCGRKQGVNFLSDDVFLPKQRKEGGGRATGLEREDRRVFSTGLRSFSPTKTHTCLSWRPWLCKGHGRWSSGPSAL